MDLKKFHKRWLGSLEYLLDNNRNYDILAIGLAGWILFCGGRDENDNLLQVSDPLQEKYQGIYAQNSSTKDIVKGFFSY